MNVPEQTLFNELNKTLRKKFSRKIQEETGSENIDIDIPEIPAPKQDEYDFNSSERNEREIIRLLLLYGNEILIFQQDNEEKEMDEFSVTVWEFIIKDLKNDEITFENYICQNILEEAFSLMNRQFPFNKEFFSNHSDPDISTLSVDLMISPYELSYNWEKNKIHVKLETDQMSNVIKNGILNFKGKRIERMREDVLKKIKEVGTYNNPFEEISFLIEKKMKLDEINIRIQNKELGRDILR